jgi:hypothetical protein
MVVSVSLRFLYPFLYSACISPIQDLSSPTPLLCDLPLLWPVLHNIAAFVLALYPTNEKQHVAFGLLSLANLNNVL